MKGTQHHRIRHPRNRDTGWNLGARRRDTARTRKPGRSLSATRLQVAGTRFYSPELGRWTSRDPIGEHSAFLRVAQQGSKEEARALLEASRSPAYLFVDNSPVDLVDLLGLYGPGNLREKCCVWWALRGTGMGTAYLIHGLADGMGKEAFADAYAHPEDWPEDWDTGDIEDAIRHCTAACMLTASFGSGRALTVLECHERLAGHSAGIEMDRWNNDRGIELGNTSPLPGPEDCLVRCREALADGELRRFFDF